MLKNNFKIIYIYFIFIIVSSVSNAQTNIPIPNSIKPLFISNNECNTNLLTLKNRFKPQTWAITESFQNYIHTNQNWKEAGLKEPKPYVRAISESTINLFRNNPVSAESGHFCDIFLNSKSSLAESIQINNIVECPKNPLDAPNIKSQYTLCIQVAQPSAINTIKCSNMVRDYNDLIEIFGFYFKNIQCEQPDIQYFNAKEQNTDSIKQINPKNRTSVKKDLNKSNQMK